MMLLIVSESESKVGGAAVNGGPAFLFFDRATAGTSQPSRQRLKARNHCLKPSPAAA